MHAQVHAQVQRMRGASTYPLAVSSIYACMHPAADSVIVVAQGVDASTGATFDPIVLHRPPAAAPAPAVEKDILHHNLDKNLTDVANKAAQAIDGILPDLLNKQHSG